MLTRAQGGATLVPEQGKPGADFTDLGDSLRSEGFQRDFLDFLS